MVTPSQQRAAAGYLLESYGVSQRRVARTLGRARSTLRYRARDRGAEQPLVVAIRRLARRHPRRLFLHAIAWSPDGTQLAGAARNGTVKIWSAAHGDHILTLTSGSKEVFSVAWSPDGKRLAATGKDDFDLKVRIWDMASRKEVHCLAHRLLGGGALAWSPDGKRLATSGETILIWNAITGNEMHAIAGAGAHFLAWSPDGRQLASGGNHVARLWNPDNGREITTLAPRNYNGGAVAWSPDVSTWSSAAMTAFGFSTSSPQGPTVPLISAAWSPDGKQMATTTAHGMIQIWDAVTGKEITNLDKPPGPGGPWLNDNKGEKFGLKDEKDGKFDGKAPSWPQPEGMYAVVLAWSPDGKQMASSSPRERTIKIRTVSTGKEALVLRGHTQPVRSLAWSPDGKWLVSVGAAGKARIWDLATAKNTVRLDYAVQQAQSLRPFGPRLEEAANRVRVDGGSTGGHQHHGQTIANGSNGVVWGWWSGIKQRPGFGANDGQGFLGLDEQIEFAPFAHAQLLFGLALLQLPQPACDWWRQGELIDRVKRLHWRAP